MIRARIFSRTGAYAACAGLLLASAVLFFGAFQSRADVTAVSISSSNQNPQVARTGDAVTLSFASPASTTPTVVIDGHGVIPQSIPGTMQTWKASYILAASDPAGAVTFSVDDGSGAVTTASNGSYVTFFPAAPLVTLYSIDAAPGAATPLGTLRVMAVFTEPVTGVTANSFQTRNAVVTSVTDSGGGQIYIATLRPVAAGAVSISLPPGEGADSAGNASGNASTLAFTYAPSTIVSIGVVTTPVPEAGAAPEAATVATNPTTAQPAANAAPGTATSPLPGTSSALTGSATAATTTGGSSGAVWFGVIVIVLLLVGGGWWYSRNITTTPS